MSSLFVELIPKAGLPAALEHLRLRRTRYEAAMACKLRFRIRASARSTLRCFEFDKPSREEAEYLLDNLDLYTMEQLHAIALHRHREEVRLCNAILSLVWGKKSVATLPKGGE